MHIAICSTQQQKEELLQKGINKSVKIDWLADEKDFGLSNADAFFNLCYNDNNEIDKNDVNEKLIFVHAVNITCKELKKKNYVRLNAWYGFLKRPVIEIACDEYYKPAVSAIFNELNWKFVFVADDYGLIAARIIAMIINEAYYALQEGVSTKAQIDIAMKLGTNYPYGPFEWSEKIGIKNIYRLLNKLSIQNKRYTIAEALQAAANK